MTMLLHRVLHESAVYIVGYVLVVIYYGTIPTMKVGKYMYMPNPYLFADTNSLHLLIII